MLKATAGAPDFDAATKYSYQWFLEQIDFLRNAPGQWDVLETYEGPRAVRPYPHDGLKNLNPDLFIFYDHGNEDHLVSNDSTSLFNENDLPLLKGRSVYTMCCLAAKVLGIKAIHAGVLEWWGYTESYTFTYDAIKEHGDVSGYGLRKAHVDGKALKDVLEETKQYFYAKADELRSSGRTVAAAIMVRDAECLVCWHPENVPSEPEPDPGFWEKLLMLLKALWDLITGQ